MKVLYLAHHFHTQTGNFSSRPYRFAKQLTEDGHKVTVVSGQHDRGAVDIEGSDTGTIRRKQVEGIDVIQVAVPYANNMSVLKRSLIFMRYTLHCLKETIKGDYDLIFATSGPLTVGIAGILSKAIRSNPFVFESRDLLPETPRALGLIKNPVILLGLSTLEWASYQTADVAVGLAPGITKAIKKKTASRIPVALLPNGSELELFKPGSRVDLKVAGIEAGDTVAVFTGAHGLTNGLHAILDAAKELKRRGRDDIKIAFFGDGKIKPELVSRAKAEGLTNCFFNDPIPKTKLAEILGSADIGLMTLKNLPVFHYSTSPNKFFDYLSCGLPIINNYPGWIAGMLSKHRNGCVVEPGDAIAFADALENYADNPELRELHGKRSRELAETSFDMARIAKAFSALMTSTHAPHVAAQTI
ncbi:glycosyltransferase family 4 protein [Pelagicoccus sp. NFK12]|uniref:Glycosyltransferase family 4 protein n=1 Tax=Pelagicoccus enzymogenes TaxID=2773457 RepID=A0A927FBQ8_9BACT|nr:glycosyltransferase family 4 protein [Pelagicoccus enzymogenes]MBD5781450.1 glycosyltransferase family 4 protein [Pelagicoccus enzymogenes]